MCLPFLIYDTIFMSIYILYILYIPFSYLSICVIFVILYAFFKSLYMYFTTPIYLTRYRRLCADDKCRARGSGKLASINYMGESIAGIAFSSRVVQSVFSTYY